MIAPWPAPLPPLATAPPAAPRPAPMAVPIRPGLAIFQVRPPASQSAEGAGALGAAGEGAATVDDAACGSVLAVGTGRSTATGALAATGSGAATTASALTATGSGVTA